LVYLIWDREKTKKRFGKRRTDEFEKFLDKMTKRGFSIYQCKSERIRLNLKKFEKKGDHFILLGGDRLIPFYRIKNPAYDGDEFVFSDNPYASIDKNFLLPERSISRIPDGNDLDFFTATIDKLDRKDIKKHSFGYTAFVWKEAAKAVYSILHGDKINVCPPKTHKSIRIKDSTTFFYFNLHGSDTSPNWYGQKGESYPIALTPSNINKLELKNGIVVSEACYGAYIIEKNKDTSIALKFLERGSSIFLGSTTIAYGPYTPPSSEADLLSRYFLKEILRGTPAGFALVKAKHRFFKYMMESQGILDEDDQKTLYQFVLYGDPRLSYRRKNG